MNNAHHHNNIRLEFVIFFYDKYFPSFGQTNASIDIYAEINISNCRFFFALKFNNSITWSSTIQCSYIRSFDRSFIHPFVHSFIGLLITFGETNEVITSNEVKAVRFV